ncbi:MAG: right-handed parallel beta-helix repeat-containing protein [Opitutaceae bacterium]|jgi:polygalacturonase|nr:right-handed parallel beta-helix repeat-containing protein [Opitutaceae bacterium]
MTTLQARDYNVRDFGATGDGKTIDSGAINRAIEAAASAGGGIVRLPAGAYMSYSVRLISHNTLLLDPGAITIAAEPPPAAVGRDLESGRAAPAGYDPYEPNEWGDIHQYQDFGHSHWRNSLIWGENLENIAITGQGLIRGDGLNRGRASRPGTANKSIALKLCRNVILRDLSMLMTGHFSVLATGVDNLTIDNLKIDTNRDGLDIDSCRHVRISNCTVNTLNDDAIVLKTSLALGFLRPVENVTITNCQVSGYDPGSLLDGTFTRATLRAPDRDGPTGRVKLGTESNGDFRNITISNCVFDRSRGIAIESVDGAVIEDIAISNITMRDVSNAAIFLLLGNRARGPAGTPVGAIRRVSIDNLVASSADARFPVIINGLPGHPVEDVRLNGIRIAKSGGLTLDEIRRQPAHLVNSFFLRSQGRDTTGPAASAPRPDIHAVPERPAAYPEPSMFGLLPAGALYARHAKNLSLRDFTVTSATPDERVPIVLQNVSGATLRAVNIQRPPGQPLALLRDTTNITARDCPALPDTDIPAAQNATIQ